MLRAAYPAMQKVALKILKNGRSKETNKHLYPIKDILELIPENSKLEKNNNIDPKFSRGY